jgi:uncharacterized heparinase superfamily protein
MYHSLILVDMLDILNICNAYPSVISSNFISLLNKNIPKMVTFMQSMAHPDGGVSFFNDSVDGIAPQKHKIEYYAEQLSFKSCFPNITNPTITNNLDSGYICVSAYNSKLIFDASPVGYSYNPGHAHADTLSFELSIGQERVFVNSGISEYEFGKNRIIQRKTRSHNTIEVNDKDSSEVWSAFRVASRANVFNRSITENHSGVQLCASHDGYKSLIRGCYVTRKIDFGENYLNISDLIDGKYEKAVSRLHFHPSLLVTLNRNILNASSEHFRLTCNLKNKSFVLSDYEYHPEFGVTLNSKVLELDVFSGYQELEFSWIFK